MTDSPVLAATAWPTNAHLIEACHQLGYIGDDDLVLDPTYGRGVWWRRWRPANLVTSDVRPGLADDVADFRQLPWDDEHFDVVAFDPPYKLNGTPTHKVDERYGVHEPTSWQDRHQLITAGIDECARVLKPGGRLLLKCQNQVCSGQVRWQTYEFAAHARGHGFRLVDELLMLAYRPQPERSRLCGTCKGTGWRCDQHLRGACARCRDNDGSLSGCPVCTAPGECGGSGRTASRQAHAGRNYSSLLVFQ